MPNPLQVPLIGSSFSDLGNQRLAWAGFNRNVEEANMARATAAEQTQNNYLANIAAIQRQQAEQAINTQLAQDAAARDFAWRTSQEATRQRERAQDIDQNRVMWNQRIDAENKRTAATQQTMADRLALAQKQQDQAIEQRGTAYAQQYSIAKTAKDAADKQYEDTMSEQESLQSQLDDLRAQKKQTDETVAQSQALSKKLMELKPKVRQVQALKAHSDNNFNRLESALSAHDFVVDEDNGTVTHGPSGKKWSFKQMVQAAKANPLTATSKEQHTLESADPADQQAFTQYDWGQIDTHGPRMSYAGWVDAGRPPAASVANGGVTNPITAPVVDVPATVTPVNTNSFNVGRFKVSVQ